MTSLAFVTVTAASVTWRSDRSGRSCWYRFDSSGWFFASHCSPLTSSGASGMPTLNSLPCASAMARSSSVSWAGRVKRESRRAIQDGSGTPARPRSTVPFVEQSVLNRQAAPTLVFLPSFISGNSSTPWPSTFCPSTFARWQSLPRQTAPPPSPMRMPILQLPPFGLQLPALPYGSFQVLFVFPCSKVTPVNAPFSPSLIMSSSMVQ